MENKFVHLKLHTEYSLLEGVGKIDEYVEKAKEIGIKALAITDTSMFGAIEFFKKCKNAGIKPIIGLEVFLDGLEKVGEYSLTLLAKNQNGYKNLSKLSSISYSRFTRNRNKIKYDELKKYSDDLYILSGGINSEVVKGILDLENTQVRRVIEKLGKDFGDNFFIEVPAVERLEKARKMLFDIVRKNKFDNFVITNDVYYPNRKDAVLQKIVESIKEGSKIDTEKSENSEILYDDLYLKSEKEIEKSFENKEYSEFYETGINNVKKIVENCNVDFEFHHFKFPKYSLPQNVSEKEFLRNLVFEGLFHKYLKKSVSEPEKLQLDKNFEIIEKEIAKDEIAGQKLKEVKIREELLKHNLENVLKRAEYELEIIDKMGYNGYFIIVWDFIKFSRENGVYVGPGRGSAAGSIVSYALNITEIDPLEYNLIFERFLNPERISMPDIDIDFDQEQREIVINYVVNKYGAEYVAHIITFGTLKARLAIRDVGRVLNVSLVKVDKIAKMIPFNTELKDALNNISEIRKMYETDREIKRVIDYSLKLEGKVRHASVHAAGVVISKDVLSDEIPTYSDGKTKIVSTQYQMKELEELGILKMDFLGLKNLTILRKTVENIEKRRKTKIVLNDIPLNDEKTYELLTKADTMGVFQCESAGIRSLMKKMKIEKFEDIIALLALYRPGPLRSGMVDDFINVKNNRTEIKYIDDSLKYILEETYGIILYQEQVMKIVSEMANYSLGEADELRRAIGKKNPELMKKNREKFVTNAQKNGVLSKKANEIYDLVEKFGGYGFNKSHSAAYALIVYWTAYFKANYPLEFFAAIMTTEVHNLDRFVVFVNEAKEKGINIFLPDVNLSDYDFEIEENQADNENFGKAGIRFGLFAIKGVGAALINEIKKERKNGKFVSYKDFGYRMKQNGITKKQLESLILSGALDGLDGNRFEKYKSIDKVLEYSQKKYESEEDLQLILFGGKKEMSVDFQMEKNDEFPQKVLLQNEKEYLGIYVSSHPLNEKKNLINIIFHNKISEISQKELKKVRIIGIVKNVKKFATRAGKEPMVKFEMEDFQKSIEVVCFPREYITFGYKITEDQIMVLEGIVNSEQNKNTVILNNICNIENLEENKNLKLYILIDEEVKEKNQELKQLILKNKGDNQVFLAFKTNEKKEVVKLSEKYNVNLSLKFIRKVVKLVGVERIKLK
ncbi:MULTISPECIES: DNA polymerase III subunit alpha [unclassified Leptotrichia]|uniref:DNA polymerase III subunit alpha n=1 Tax=unclassified Leptotrichia TaxID=2633022 RepID=UPI0003AD97B4|nr:MULTISPECIES: DNA polymerase III subunit alpha [unclassified Leptotrichia]ERL25800.1 DNA polymerase III, alpha subunit [Leptotrichia sp. oral taxon 225 str. F0581]WLD74843.1 DNA polymerase III subunit alpha [Leptotrichia sp. HMT-225]